MLSARRVLPALVGAPWITAQACTGRQPARLPAEAVFAAVAAAPRGV